MSGPLDGITVLDFTSVVSGPVCTQSLAAFGATVFKVEPVTGDTLRNTRQPQIDSLSGLFIQNNRGKRSVALDLRDPDANRACRALAAQADVVVENFRPGVMERLGLSYETLKEDNPDLIYASISGFGTTGPWSNSRAYDSMIQALGGFMYLQGDDGQPAMVQCAVADKITGKATAEAVLAALVGRSNGGGGQRIEIAMLDAYVSFMFLDMMAGRTFLDHEAEGAHVNVHTVFRTADGWISFLFLSAREFHGFFEACGRADLAQDARFATFPDIYRNYHALEDVLREVLVNFETDILIDRCRALELPVAPVQSFEQMVDMDQVIHNGIFSTADMGEGVGPVRLLNLPWMPASANSEPLLPPRLGEHTREALTKAGMSAADIDTLIARGGAMARQASSV